MYISYSITAGAISGAIAGAYTGIQLVDDIIYKNDRSSTQIFTNILILHSKTTLCTFIGGVIGSMYGPISPILTPLYLYLK